MVLLSIRYNVVCAFIKRIIYRLNTFPLTMIRVIIDKQRLIFQNTMIGNAEMCINRFWFNLPFIIKTYIHVYQLFLIHSSSCTCHNDEIKCDFYHIVMDCPSLVS